MGVRRRAGVGQTRGAMPRCAMDVEAGERRAGARRRAGCEVGWECRMGGSGALCNATPCGGHGNATRAVWWAWECQTRLDVEAAHLDELARVGAVVGDELRHVTTRIG